MKNEQHIDFSVPARQSRAAIVVSLYRFARIIAQQIIWPLIIFYFLGKRNDSFSVWIAIAALGIGFFSILSATLSYLFFYFSMENKILMIRSGIIGRKRISVPLERIQSVQFEQNLLHRLFNVVRVLIDTAGSEGSEVQIDALNMNDAELLRKALLPEERTTHAQISTDVTLPSDRNLFNLSVSDTVKVGLGQNHLRTAGLIFGFGVGIYFQLVDMLDLNLEEILGGFLPQLKISKQDPIFMLIIFIMALGFTIGFSLVRTMLRYYNFSIWTTKDGFRLSMGLLKKQEYAIKRHKVQYIRWSQNWLMGLFDHYLIRLYQASSRKLRKSTVQYIPGCKPENRDAIIEMLTPRPAFAKKKRTTGTPNLFFKTVDDFGGSTNRPYWCTWNFTMNILVL